MKKIILATGNKSKIKEQKPILNNILKKTLFKIYPKFANEEFEILTFEDLRVDIDIEEGTESLEENAAKKAVESYEYLLSHSLIKKDDIVVAEDSGLFDIELNYPGVITKREIERLGVQKLINRICSTDDNQKDTAYYKSVFAIYSNNLKMLTEAREYGRILKAPEGDYNYPLDKYFISSKRGKLGNIPEGEFSKTSFRNNSVPQYPQYTFYFKDKGYKDKKLTLLAQKSKTLSFLSKNWEMATLNSSILKHRYVLIRVDGRAFHTYHKKLKNKAFNETFRNQMEQAMLATANEFNALMCYHQSDEITFVLKREINLNEKMPFNGRMLKLLSLVSSSITHNFMLERIKSGESIDSIENVQALFDARAMDLNTYESVYQNLMWRAYDAYKNSINMMIHERTRKNEFDGVSTEDRLKYLNNSENPWDNLSEDFKYGELYIKETVKLKNLDGIEFYRKKLIKQDSSELLYALNLINV